MAAMYRDGYLIIIEFEGQKKQKWQKQKLEETLYCQDQPHNRPDSVFVNIEDGQCYRF
jgi:hypothetical protein